MSPPQPIKSTRRVLESDVSKKKLEVSLHFWCIWPTVWRRHGAAVACATSSAYSVALTSFLIRPRLALSTIAAHFAQWSKYKPLCWQLYNRMDLTIICMDGLYYYCIVVEFSRSNSKCLMYTSVQTTVFSHIVAMATILFWNCKTLKISNSFCIKFSLM